MKYDSESENEPHTRLVFCVVLTLVSLASTQAYAYETQIPKKLAVTYELSTAIDSTSNSDCELVGQPKCFYQTFNKNDGVETCSVVFEVPLVLGEGQEDIADSDVTLVGVAVDATDASSGDVSGFRVDYDYDDYNLVVSRDITDSSSNVQTLGYTVLDDVTPLFDLGAVAIQPVLRVYASENYSWISLHDGGEPLFASFYVTPLFYGLGPYICNTLSLGNDATVYAPAPIDTHDDPPQEFRQFGDKDPLALRLYDYDVDDLISDINTNYSQPSVVAPFTENGRMSTALALAVFSAY